SLPNTLTHLLNRCWTFLLILSSTCFPSGVAIKDCRRRSRGSGFWRTYSFAIKTLSWRETALLVTWRCSAISISLIPGCLLIVRKIMYCSNDNEYSADG